jgi:flagellar biosynthetic protein FliR
MAGHLAGLQMGLGFATFYDPQHSTNVPIIAQFASLLMLLVFLSMNGHLMMLQVLFDSYVQLPIQAGLPNGDGFRMLAEFGAIIFRAGVMLSLPVMGALLVTNLSIGVMTRAAPQLNVFAVGFPITLGIGFAGLYMLLPYLVPHIDSLLATATRFIPKMLEGLAR